VNCLGCRRLLLTAPRDQSREQVAHLVKCEACARLLGALTALDRQIEEAAAVRVPEGLVHRVLLAGMRAGAKHWTFGFDAN
jgi:hypothetical protein